jgi:hypothetical protein
MRNRRALVVACLALAWITAASAQTTTSSLKGTVKDLGGRPVEGASVLAKSVSRGELRSTTSDREGRFRFDLLKPGLWTVAANLPDGSTTESRTVTLRLQEAATLDLTLGKGLSEQVTVRAEAPLVDSQRTGAEVRIGSVQANELPFAGRVVTDVPLVNAAVKSAPTTDFVGERGAAFVVNGQSGRSNSFLVDGLDNNDRVSGTSMNASFSQLAVRELVLNTGRYAAEFGRASGAIFNIVTEQGSNLETGEMFLQAASPGLNSPGEFVSSLPAPDGSDGVGSRYETGFKLGGPIREDKTFYFAAYERQREDKIVPYTGVDRNSVVGGWMVAPQKDDNLFLRADFNLSPSQLLMVRLSGDARGTEGLNVGGFSTPETGFHVEEHDVQLASSLTSVFSPAVFNEARLLVGTSAFHQFADSSRPGVDRPSGSFGGNQLNVQLRDEDKLELVDNLTWRLGSHTMKYGFDVTRTRTNVKTRFNPQGNFLYITDAPYNPGNCSEGVFFFKLRQAIDNGTYPLIPCWDAPPDDPLEGAADIGTYPVFFVWVDGEPRAELWDTQVAAFAQDGWQLGSRLLLDYGLRYDVSTFQLPATARVNTTIPNGGAVPDRNNVAPRLGFTYTGGSDRQWVVRGGGGVFYDKLALAFPAVAAVMSGTEIRLVPIQATTFPITESVVEDPAKWSEIEKALTDPASPFKLDNLIMRFSTGTRLDTPRTVQWSLGLERRIGSRGSVQVEATRALGYNLPLMKDLNPVVAYKDPWFNEYVAQPDPELRYYYTPVHRDEAAGVPYEEQTGSIAAIVTEGRSWYEGLDVVWRWQGEGGWYTASYTLSRSEDMAPDPLKGGIYLPPDSDNLSGERGRSDADRLHRFVLSGEHALPWMGLRASGVIQLSSAAPFNVTTGQDDNLDGITTDRPVGVGRNTGEDTPPERINSLRERENELRRLRNQPELSMVGSLHAPSFFQVDLRISKPFAAREMKTRGEMFLQVFNLFDRLNGGLVDGRVVSPTFGQVIGLAGPPRTLELGVRLAY